MVRFEHKQRKNKRGYTLKVGHDGKISVITSKRCSSKDAEKILVKNLDWVKIALKKQSELYREMNEKLESLKITKTKIQVAKGIAESYIDLRAKELSKIIGVSDKITGIEIKNYKSKWGTCDSRGKLTFNWRLLLMPRHLSDYIIIHELCHLKHLNHSSKFWNTVSEYCIDFDKSRKILAKDYYVLMNIS